MSGYWRQARTISLHCRGRAGGDGEVGSPPPSPPRTPPFAARNEEQRLEVLGRQLEQQLAEVRREKKDVEELLGFLERKRGVEATI